MRPRRRRAWVRRLQPDLRRAALHRDGRQPAAVRPVSVGLLGAPGTGGAIHLCMCESGINLVNTNIPAFFGTTTSVYNQLGVSWSAEAYDGPLGVIKADGSYQPWLPIFQQAAAYGQTGDQTPPGIMSLEMQDTNSNGKVDHVTAKFSEPLGPYTAGTAPWTLTGAPSGGTLSSVSVT